MKSAFAPVDERVWGYRTPFISPASLIRKIRDAVAGGIDAYEILPDPDPATSRPGYHRVTVEFDVDKTLFDQFFNGPTGYRAQYYAGPESGESFDHALVDAIAPLIVAAQRLYSDKITPSFCQHSLTGPHTKFWFSKRLTDPADGTYLMTLDEVVRPPVWVNYWKDKSPPRKGLLAPGEDPEGRCTILLNGTFIHSVTGDVWDQKPGRARELHESGWT